MESYEEYSNSFFCDTDNNFDDMEQDQYSDDNDYEDQHIYGSDYENDDSDDKISSQDLMKF